VRIGSHGRLVEDASLRSSPAAGGPSASLRTFCLVGDFFDHVLVIRSSFAARRSRVGACAQVRNVVCTTFYSQKFPSTSHGVDSNNVFSIATHNSLPRRNNRRSSTMPNFLLVLLQPKQSWRNMRGYRHQAQCACGMRCVRVRQRDPAGGLLSFESAIRKKG
jgi:hypothetical protein